MGTGTVLLPGVLRPAVGDVRTVAVEGETVRDALEDLCRQHPTIRPRLLDGKGKVRRHVLVVLEDEPVDPEDGIAFADGAELVIMPAVSGG